jgi:hypothetical protein
MLVPTGLRAGLPVASVRSDSVFHGSRWEQDKRGNGELFATQ